MGTTLVAMTLRPEEEAISIVNVGDSRAYFLRANDFKQLTLDHSLVEDLVRQNRLTPEEALTHPQRNILTRALGIASEVEVDRFLHEAVIGDRYLLCSDGLFNEVTEDEIIRILMEFEEPNLAADTLVNAALAGAARDNVTVAVVDVVADGHGGNVSTHAPETIQVPVAPMAGADTIEVEPTTGEAGPHNGVDGVAPGAGYEGEYEGEYGGEDVNFGEGAGHQNRGEPIMQSAGLTQAGAAAAGVDLVDVDLAAEERAYNEALGSVDTIEFQPAGANRRGSRFRRILFGFVILVVVAGAGYYAANFYATSKWYVAQTSTGQLAIFNGRSGGFLWIDPELVETREDIIVEDLVEEDKFLVLGQQMFDSQAEVNSFVDGLESKPAGVETLEQIGPSDEETNTTTSAGANVGSSAESTTTSPVQPTTTTG